jgi:DnaD/phage-associated family protein
LANARLLHKKISRSDQVDALSDGAKLLYTWGVAHADDFGRMDGRPRIVRTTVVPLREWTDGQIECFMLEMQREGLVELYESNGVKVMQYTGFDAHQSGLHKRTRSQFPEPPDKFPELPGIVPPESESESELEPESERVVVDAREPEPSDTVRVQTLATINRYFPMWSQSTLKFTELLGLGDELGWPLVGHALEIIAGNQVNKLPYLLAILRGWKDKGVQSVEDAKAAVVQFQAERERKPAQARASPKGNVILAAEKKDDNYYDHIYRKFGR